MNYFFMQFFECKNSQIVINITNIATGVVKTIILCEILTDLSTHLKF